VPLVGTKFERAPAPSNAVARPRVAALLASSAAPFTLVVAGPGYGKTVVVGQWLDDQDGAVAWVSLDANDDGSAVFWRYVTEGIRRATGHVGTEALRMIEHEQAPYSVLSSLLSELVAATDELTVVLDDLHVIRSRAVLDELAFFIERLPRTVRVVALSRVDPALPLGRWRVSGGLTELRQQHLVFQTDEASALFGAELELAVDEDDVAFLNERTEGWAAGLQLAALSLRGREDPHEYIQSMLADDRLIADYLVGEVLDRLSESDRALVLDLAVLDDFDIELAAAVTGHRDVGDRVRSLESRNLFLLPVDQHRARFRFHQLLRELLQGELRWRAPDREALLHARAAEHLRSRGAIHEAVGHFVAAGQLDVAYELVAAPSWQNVDLGNLAAARHWLASFPPEFVERDPGRVLTHVLLLTASGRVDDAHSLLRRFGDGSDADAAALARQRVALLTIVEYIRGDLEACRRAAQHCLDLIGDEPLAGAALDRVGGVLVRLAVDARDVPEAEHWIGRVGVPGSESLVLSDLLPGVLVARIALLAGRLSEAESTARRVLELAGRHEIRTVIPVGEAHMTLAAVLLETGRLPEAELHNTMAVEILAELGITMLEAEARLLAVTGATARFGPRAGLALLEVTRRAFGDRYLGPHIHERFNATECRLRLLTGDLTEAQGLLEDLPAGTDRDLLVARCFVLEGRFDDVARTLRDHDAARWTVAAQIEALTLLARSQPVTDANDHVRHAASLSMTHRCLHTFLREGPDLLRIARRAHRAAPSAEIAELLALAEPASRSVERPTFTDPLTEREQMLLDMLPTHLTYQEMANDLCVSINTVKTYQKTVFRKLNASSRSEAVATARSARLLTRAD
jgi:LuxR family maltose regulon positive regulatory protein